MSGDETARGSLTVSEGEGAEPSLWETFLADSRALPVAELRRLDAAEAIVHEQFGISPAYYVRANEYPYAAKLEHIVAALVLRREEWETAG